MKKSILEKYKDRTVNPKYYATIKISGDTNTVTHTLTKKEFQEGKQGLVYVDTITGRLMFHDDEQPLSILEQIELEQRNKPPVRIEEELEKMNRASRKPKNIVLYGRIEFIEKLRKILPKKYFK
jgi:hypothetical protein